MEQENDLDLAAKLNQQEATVKLIRSALQKKAAWKEAEAEVKRHFEYHNLEWETLSRGSVGDSACINPNTANKPVQNYDVAKEQDRFDEPDMTESILQNETDNCNDRTAPWEADDLHNPRGNLCAIDEPPANTIDPYTQTESAPFAHETELPLNVEEPQTSNRAYGDALSTHEETPETTSEEIGMGAPELPAQTDSAQPNPSVEAQIAEALNIQIQRLSPIIDVALGVRSRLLEREFVVKASRLDRDIIGRGNKQAHQGNVLVDALLYMQEGLVHRRVDVDKFLQFYGVIPSCIHEMLNWHSPGGPPKLFSLANWLFNIKVMKNNHRFPFASTIAINFDKNARELLSTYKSCSDVDFDRKFANLQQHHESAMHHYETWGITMNWGAEASGRN